MKSLKVQASEAKQVGHVQIDEAYYDETHHCRVWRNVSLCIVTKRITVHCEEKYYCSLWRNISLCIRFFSVIDRNVFEMTKKNSNVGQNVRKYRQKTLLWWVLIQLWVNDRNVLMTKLSQQKWSKCFSKRKKK